MTNLAGERCVACRSYSPRATEAEIAQFMPLIPEWEQTDHNGVPHLERTFRFTNYTQALAFTQKVGALAEEEGHHPAMLVEWGRVKVSWWTHAIKGLHRNDFIMAVKTDQIDVRNEPVKI